MFNYTDGMPIAIIKTDDPRNKKNNKVVYYKEEPDEFALNTDDIKLSDGEHFEFLPNPKGRLGMYVAGKNGSGKSFYISKFLINYIKMFPKHKIYLFSEKDRDEQLDKFEKIKRINLDDILQNPISYPDLVEVAQDTGVLCIFDDVDTLTGKLKAYIYALIAKILKVGRQDKVNIIATNHEITNANETKSQLKESNVIVWFGRNYNIQLQNLCKKYCAMMPSDIKRWRKSHSRAVTYIELYPNSAILTEKELFLINKDLDD
jgi:hypothetical protein